MDITVRQRLPYSREIVFSHLRDHLGNLVPYLPNVASIEVRERVEPQTGVVELLNLWQAAASEVPAVVRPFVDPNKLSWNDRATWKAADWSCDWVIEVSFMRDRVRCSGRTVYVAIDEGHTEIRVDGALEVDLKGLVPRLLVGRVKPKVEGFVVKTIKPNFEKVNDGLKAYLDAQKK